MKQPSSITSLPPSPTDERHSRMVKYTVAMGIRMVCIVCLLFAQGWWLLFFALGAVVLPYVAVVLANVGGTGEGGVVDRPGGLVRIQQQPDGTRSGTVPPQAGAADPSAPPSDARPGGDDRPEGDR